MKKTRKNNYTVELNRKNLAVKITAQDNEETIKGKRGKLIVDGNEAKSGHKQGKVAKHIVKNDKKYAIGALAAGLAMFVIAGSVSIVAPRVTSYALTVDGKQVCCVKTKNDAEEAVKTVLETYSPEGTSVKSANSDGKIKIEKVAASSCDETVEPAVAAEKVVENCGESEEAVDVAVASIKTEIKEYIPEPEYVKDDTMLAGESKVKEEGVAGTQEVTTTYTTINGEIVDEQETNVEILDEGTSAVVVKGTLGLPEGEDWETYTGDPVYKDGGELVQTAQNYLGAPYKYGGYSLTNGIDCVQFIRQMYAKYGISLPNGKYALQHVGTSVSLKNAQKGDIICYSGHHYALYLGDNKIIHAVKGGVSIGNNASYRGIVTVRRVVQ